MGYRMYSGVNMVGVCGEGVWMGARKWAKIVFAWITVHM